jgi:EAL domain-containing protein (putative c-di-GMP-specific phosphodiesterase class I)
MVGIAVNVSARQLDTDQFVTDVRNALSESGLEPGALTLEITETTLMRNLEETARRLSAVRKLGVRIAIDDFGTGYSSLAHLQRLPIDALKIDRSFISRLTDSPEGEALIHTLVQLGKALSIETLAEGIEGSRKSSRCFSRSTATPARASSTPGRWTQLPRKPSCRSGPTAQLQRWRRRAQQRPLRDHTVGR